MSDTVCAVVVTFNRRELLRECLAAVGAQTRAVDAVLVVDNASTDGTAEIVADEFPDVELVTLPQNIGGAGGNHAGIARALDQGHRWLWLMDDDTIPTPEALERLLDAPAQLEGLPEPIMLASKVVWTDGRLHPMNWPDPRVADVGREFLPAVERGFVPIRTATFPSLLVRRDAIERHGLPRAGFFIWYDDTEWTARLLRSEAGYLVLSSVAVHKTARAHTVADGGPRFYYALRNGLYILRTDAYGAAERARHGLRLLAQTRRYLERADARPEAARVVLRGLRDGLLRPVPD